MQGNKPTPIEFDKWDSLMRATVPKTDTELVTELIVKFNELLESL